MNAKFLNILFLLILVAVSSVVTAASGGLLDRSYRPLAGKTDVHLGKTYAGQVLLVVNTASKCGFTPQFEALEALHARYKARGFAVLGFPSGDFMNQEYADEKEIREFCTLTYGVKFPMFSKTVVTGAQAAPFYQQLATLSGRRPLWNFHKYLIGRDGKLVANYSSLTAPDDRALLRDIEKQLALQEITK